MKKVILLTIILLCFFILVSCSNQDKYIEEKQKNISKVSENNDWDYSMEEKTTYFVSNEDELDIGLKDNYSITLINDIATNRELILEGNFLKTEIRDVNKTTEVGRRLNLCDSNVDNYKLISPKLIIRSKNTVLRGGSFVGDIYIESNGVIIDSTKVQGNIFFKDKKYKESFKLQNGAIVDGKIEIK